MNAHHIKTENTSGPLVLFIDFRSKENTQTFRRPSKENTYQVWPQLVQWCWRRRLNVKT
jgi:hypothetical protein